MKLGTFVGKEDVALTDAEIKELTDLIKAAADKVGITSAEFEFSDDSDTINKLIDTRHLIIRYRLIDRKAYRDECGNHVMPTNIYVMVYKDRGYDSKEEKVNRGAPQLNYTSYHCFIDLSGRFRKYHSKVVYSSTTLGRSYFEYGTEISDLDFEKAFSGIVEYLSTITSEKDTFKKYERVMR